MLTPKEKAAKHDQLYEVLNAHIKILKNLLKDLNLQKGNHVNKAHVMGEVEGCNYCIELLRRQHHDQDKGDS